MEYLRKKKRMIEIFHESLSKGSIDRTNSMKKIKHSIIHKQLAEEDNLCYGSWIS